MISVEQALAILHDNIPEPVQKHIPLEQAYNCRVCENIYAPEASPRYTNSAMDGFAVKWADCQHATEAAPATLRIIGESRAGEPFSGQLASGTAIRISTGAMLPDSADSIVRMEDARERGDSVDILSIRALGQDVRYQGEEFHQGELLFPKSTCLRARELALLASVGLHRVNVFMPPGVSLLITGTELAQFDDQDIKPHQIRDSNAIMLESAVKDSGALLRGSTRIEDSLSHTIQAITEAAALDISVILCSGGVSVGRHDHVKDAAKEVGFQELFWKIRQKPGKPLFVGRKGNILLFGLPGNPVSAYMCFRNYVRPVLAELQGTQSLNHSITAKATEKISNTGSRTNFIRVVVDNKPNEIARITEVARQGSHMLSSIVHADGYIVLKPGETIQPCGLAEVFLF
jgi:molybdopterin molybdotransferase